MTRKAKIALIVTSVILLVAIVSLTSVSLAIWTGQGGGSTNYGPDISTTDWNSWVKYFEYDNYNDTTRTCSIVSFEGTALQNVIIPKTVEHNGNTYTITEIKASVFQNQTLKQIPVTLVIPNTIITIAPCAFQNCVNLQSVIIETSETLSIGMWAFAGCSTLTSFEVENRAAGGNLTIGESAFANTPLPSVKTYNVVIASNLSGITVVAG